jgi:hypothetical protein
VSSHISCRSEVYRRVSAAKSGRIGMYSSIELNLAVRPAMPPPITMTSVVAMTLSDFIPVECWTMQGRSRRGDINNLTVNNASLIYR